MSKPKLTKGEQRQIIQWMVKDFNMSYSQARKGVKAAIRTPSKSKLKKSVNAHRAMHGTTKGKLEQVKKLRNKL